MVAIEEMFVMKAKVNNDEMAQELKLSSERERDDAKVAILGYVVR